MKNAVIFFILFGVSYNTTQRKYKKVKLPIYTPGRHRGKVEV